MLLIKFGITRTEDLVNYQQQDVSCKVTFKLHVEQVQATISILQVINIRKIKFVLKIRKVSSNDRVRSITIKPKAKNQLFLTLELAFFNRIYTNFFYL